MANTLSLSNQNKQVISAAISARLPRLLLTVRGICSEGAIVYVVAEGLRWCDVDEETEVCLRAGLIGRLMGAS